MELLTADALVGEIAIYCILLVPGGVGSFQNYASMPKKRPIGVPTACQRSGRFGQENGGASVCAVIGRSLPGIFGDGGRSIGKYV